MRFVQAEALEQQLDMGSVVLLSSLAYSAAGEVLNCNAHEVATHAAVELRADKLIILTLDAVAELGLPHWLPLNDAEELMAAHMARAAAAGEPVPPGVCRVGNLLPDASGVVVSPEAGSAPLPELQLDLDCWQALRFPNSLLAAVAACKNGVRRAHLVDAHADGGLLLELYSRDGTGTMISTDFYECAPRSCVATKPVVQPSGAEARAPQGHPTGGAAGPEGHPGAPGAAGAGGHHARALARGAGGLAAGLHRGGARVQGAPLRAACTSPTACFCELMRSLGAALCLSPGVDAKLGRRARAGAGLRAAAGPGRRAGRAALRRAGRVLRVARVPRLRARRRAAGLRGAVRARPGHAPPGAAHHADC